MTEQELAALASWIADVGLEGAAETALIEGFCGRAVASGLPLARAIVFIDTLHPIHEGRVFRWERGKAAGTARSSRPACRILSSCASNSAIDAASAASFRKLAAY